MSSILDEQMVGILEAGGSLFIHPDTVGYTKKYIPEKWHERFIPSNHLPKNTVVACKIKDPPPFFADKIP